MTDMEWMTLSMAPGLAEARELLNVDTLSNEEKRAYYRHLDNVVILRDNITTERAEGRFSSAYNK